MWKTLFIALGIILLLCICVAAAISIVHTTELPRILTERSLEKKLGTEVFIHQLTTEWGNDTQLSGIRFQLPTEQPWFVEIDSVRVKHNHLLNALIGNLKLFSIQTEGAALRLYSDDKDIVRFTAGNADITVHIQYNTGEEKATVSTILIDDKNFGHIKTIVSVNEQEVQIKDIDGTVFTGEVSGQTDIQMDNWKQTRVEIAWQNVDLRRLGQWLPEAAPWLGVTTGRIEIEPSEQKHPLEPLSFNADININNDIFGDLNMESVRFSGAVGRKRFLLTDIFMPVLDGIVQGRMRLSKKEHGFFLYTKCSFNDLNLNRAAKIFAQNPNDIVGRLNGNGYLMTSLTMEDMSGSVNLALQGSNLAGSRIVGTLYNALNLKSNVSDPRGHGWAELRFSGKQLNIADFYYYNRGVEILGEGRILNLSQGKNSPVQGAVLATTRPLKDINLPGMETLDKLLFFAQKDTASVQIGGTVDDIQVEVVALPQIRSFLRNLLGGSD